MGVFSNKKERVAALEKVAIFGGLPKTDLGVIAQHTDEATVENGTLLATQGRAPKHMALLVNGSAKVRRNKRTIATLGPGDTIGELSLIDGGQQTADVVCDGPCDVLLVPAQEFRVLVDDSPAFARKLMKSMAQRLREADEHLAP